MDPIISIDNVSFSYNKARVVENIHLEIKQGEYVGIIGPNGSGKTTLLRLIVGLLRPQSGNVYLFGKPLKDITDWTKIGYIPQKAAQFDSHFPITVNEVVSLGRIAKKGLFGKFASNDYHIMDHVLEMAGIADLKQRLMSQLSGGQQQRVFIAKALASEPDILILDEPTVGVDVESQEKFYTLLSHLNKKEGKTIVIVSHDIDVIANEVSTIACINKHLVYHGAPKQFIKEDYIEKLYGKGRKFIIHGH